MTTDELWHDFYLHLRARRRSEKTIIFYRTTQHVFGRFAEAHQLPEQAEQLTIRHLRLFLRDLEQSGLAPGGIHAHARALRALFNWAEREDLLDHNPVKRLEMPSVSRRRLPTVTPEQVKELVKASNRLDQPKRDTALLMLMFDTGLRIQEVANLQLEDLLLDRGLLRVTGKGDKERFVPIGANSMLALKVYLRRERKPLHDRIQTVFVNRMGRPLTKSGMTIRLHKLTRLVGRERAECAPHAFRRGFAVEFLRNGGDVFTLQQILGHSSLDMTRRYVTFLDDDLRAAHLRYSPGDRL